MNKNEAAEFLGVSIRTLERYAAQGVLKQGRERAKTRPRTTYAKEELEALKKTISRPKKTTVGETATLSDTVAFRLDPLYVRRLTSEAEERGWSAGEYARHLVIKSLETSQDKAIEACFRQLKKQLGDVLYVFLVTEASVSKERAREILDKVLVGA